MYERLPREFLLCACCCRWPASAARDEAVRSAAAEITDWPRFLRVVKRQRVAGLVYHALSSSAAEMPTEVMKVLFAQAGQIARQNLALAAETVRLQRRFDDAGIPILFFKGGTLAQLAYGSLALKHGKDIDLLVAPDRAAAAWRLLESEGYEIWQPAAHIGEAGRAAVLRYGKEAAFFHHDSSLQVELHWHLADNPLLLKGVDIQSPLQCVALSSEAGVRTLNDEDLFAYLCVHGAVHGWSRLKWLADFNAYIAGKTFEQLEHLYRHAQTRGAGLCAGQALLLCRWLLALQLPMVLEAELQECRRLRRLAKIALNVMAVPDPETELDMRRFGTTRVYLAQFLLGRGIKYFIWHCRIVSVSIDCMIAYPLPKFLYFLHPPLRISLWVWWRMRYFGFNTAAQTKAKRRNFKIKVREI